MESATVRPGTALDHSLTMTRPALARLYTKDICRCTEKIVVSH
jgi:hypothetical protein